MKNLILILITILTSITVTSQVRFDYLKWMEDNEKENTPGYIYYTSDPDTAINETLKSSIIYYFDNEGTTAHFIPVNRIKVKLDEVIYFGTWENERYKTIYNKKHGDFTIIKRAILPRNGYTLFFHRDYDYYDQLTAE